MTSRTVARSTFLLISILLSLPAHAAGDGADWSWISQAVGKSSNEVVNDARWRPLLRKVLPPVKMALGVSKHPVPLADSVVELIGGPADDVTLVNGLVRLSACRPHDCPEKGMAVFDPSSHRVTFALVHFIFGDNAVVSDQPMLLVVSNGPAPPPEQLAVVNAWLDEKGVKPGIRRYLRPSGEVVDLDAASTGAPSADDVFGGLSLGLSEAAVVKLLGKPANRSKVAEEAASGLRVSTWTWPATGVTLVMDTTDKRSAKINRIQLSAPSSLRNAKGVGIGSKRAEVVAVFRSRISTDAADATSPDTIVVGSVYGGVIFDMKGDEVAGIIVGATAE